MKLYKMYRGSLIDVEVKDIGDVYLVVGETHPAFSDRIILDKDGDFHEEAMDAMADYWRYLKSKRARLLKQLDEVEYEMEFMRTNYTPDPNPQPGPVERGE